MNGWLYFLPTGALGIVLCRMWFLGLHRTRTAEFVFLSAWLVASFSTLLFFQTQPFNADRYARAFGIAVSLALLTGLPVFLRAVDAMMKAPRSAIVTSLVVLGAAILLTGKPESFPASGPGLAPSIEETLWGNGRCCLLMGLLPLLSSFYTELPDSYLLRGIGGFLVLYGGGILLVRFHAFLEWPLILAGAAVWLLLAWYVGPRPDVLVSLEKLALVPAAFLRLAPREPDAGVPAPALQDARRARG